MNKIKHAINTFIEWRGDYVSEPLEIVDVEQVLFADAKPFACSTNAQLLKQRDPSNFDVVSGWLIGTEPNNNGLYNEHIIISHYWNYMRDENIYIDITPRPDDIPDQDYYYIKDSAIYQYARFLHNLGISDVSLIAPSYLLDSYNEMIELECQGDGVSTLTNNVVQEGSLGHIFRRVCRDSSGKFHPLLAEALSK